MDPSQVDQVLANLCVNARDAITRVGTVTIETSGQTFDHGDFPDHSVFIPGDFVRLAVTDNGRGMDKETMDKLFEPFYTTKDNGKKGLYGFVRRFSHFHGGSVD